MFKNIKNHNILCFSIPLFENKCNNEQFYQHLMLDILLILNHKLIFLDIFFLSYTFLIITFFKSYIYNENYLY